MPDRLLVDALRAACTRHGPRDALVGEGTSLTYETLWRDSGDLAATVEAVGSPPSAPIAVRCANHPTDFVAMLAVWRAGGVVVPIHRTAPPEVARRITDKARCVATLDLLAPDRASVVSTLGSASTTDDGSAEDRRRMLDDGALVIFTSGSTGEPKGAVLSHAAFHGKLRQNRRYVPEGAGTRTLLVLNDTFSFGLWVALLTLVEGGELRTMSRFSPQAFLDALAGDGVTFVGVVPTMIRALFGALSADEIDAARRRIIDSGRLRRVVIGGEPLGTRLSADLRAFIAPAELHDVYGLTETSTSDFTLEPADHAAHPDSIGRPFPGIAFRLVADGGRVAGTGEAGELQLRTPYLMRGYLGDPALTAAAFDDGWFRTGDLATCDATGFVTIVGRLKEVIVRGGNKITPIEVERALLCCEGVANALVAGLPDPILGQRIHALLVPRAGARLQAATIRQQLGPWLEKYKQPDVYYVDDALPTGRTGKIDRGQLQRMLSAQALAALPE